MTTGTTDTTGTTNYSPMCLEPSAFLIKAFTQILSHRARKETRSVLKSTVRVAIKNTALLRAICPAYPDTFPHFII